MLRFCLIGPGDIKFHFFELLKFSEEDLNEYIDGIAKVLKNLDVEFVLLPYRGFF
ncbi:MAG: hypothetical protein NZ893_01425 [Candidatus Aenigmarchaeota archaeon]|nr:hypothetical protein [Candidatus Aenigmarchaeota archaeon]